MNVKNDRNEGYLLNLAGLKAICMLLLFWWHSSLPAPNIGLGARTCEFLFLTSGFLIGYNYYNKDVPATWKESFRYVLAKLKKFWPLHFIAMVMVLFLNTQDVFSVRTIINAILNLSLLQAWSMNKYVHYSFNGASWFLSALMFCYFLSPALLKMVKSVKSPYFLVAFVFVIRLLIEVIALRYPGEYFNIRFHIYPPVRAIEFFMGMSMVPIYIKMKSWGSRRSCFFMSIIELATICTLIFTTITFNEKWPRACFVLLAAILLYVYAFDRGICSKAMAVTPLRWMSSIQFEFYILHQAMIRCFGKLFSTVFQNIYISNVAMFVSIIVASLLYKRLWEEKCSNLFGHIANNIMEKAQVRLRI